MSRRIEVELTSSRDDGTWTWRAAGARQPKGVVATALVPSGAGVGDVLRADVDNDIEGVTIIALHAGPARQRKEPERLELLGAGTDEPLVTTKLAGRGGRDRRGSDRDRPGRRGQDARGRGHRPDERGDRRDRADQRPDGPRPQRRPQPEPSAVPARPKPRRLRPGRAHRKAVLAELPAEQQPVAEQVLRGGIPAVRQAIEKQNEQARAEGRPEVQPGPIMTLAEDLVPRLRVAEWQDRAEAAVEGLDDIDLRDLRSVVVAADDNARDADARALADKLRDGLNQRLEQEQQQWLTDLAQLLDEGRTVRALRLSSRPPKAGAPLPADLATRLTESATAALTTDVAQDRWAALLDALSFSPVRRQVQPPEVPASPSDELLTVVRKVASRLPELAARFGVAAPPETPRPAGGRGRKRAGTAGAGPARASAGSQPPPRIPPPPPLDAAPAPPLDTPGATPPAAGGSTS